jgi:hypothetical protein
MPAVDAGATGVDPGPGGTGPASATIGDPAANSGIREPGAADEPIAVPDASDVEPERAGRPFIERVGMAAIALVFAVLFGVTAAAAWQFGEPFLAAMAGLGCLMAAWVGVLTLLRG